MSGTIRPLVTCPLCNGRFDPEDNPRLKELKEKGDEFEKDRKKETEYVEATHRYYQGCGFFTEKYPLSTMADGTKTDIHDLGVMLPVSVKSRLYGDPMSVKDFSANRDGFLYSYSTVIIGTCAHVNRGLRFYNSPPNFHWTWNQKRTGALVIVVAETFKHWVRRYVSSKYTNPKPREHYMCPLFWNEADEVPIYTSRHLVAYVKEHGDPNPLPGVEFLTASMLNLQIKRKVAGARKMLETLNRSQWLVRDELIDEDPGHPEW